MDTLLPDFVSAKQGLFWRDDAHVCVVVSSVSEWGSYSPDPFACSDWRLRVFVFAAQVGRIVDPIDPFNTSGNWYVVPGIACHCETHEVNHHPP